MKIPGKISIDDRGDQAVLIEIEGVIGTPEEWQFEEPGQRITTYERFRNTLEEIKNLETREVVVDIRSVGGNVNDALLIHDALRDLGGTVTTRCYGYVASAATIIAQAASEGKRQVSSNSLYLIHRAESAADGNAEDIARTKELLEQTDLRIISVYAARSGRPEEEFAALMGENGGKGRWLSPQEAISRGLADGVIPAVPISDEDLDMVTNLGLPPLPQNGMPSAGQWKTLLHRIGVRARGKTVGDGQGSFVPSGGPAGRNMLSLYRTRVEELKNRVESLEAENARLLAGKTATCPKEDPSYSAAGMNSNQTAYSEDIRNFR